MLATAAARDATNGGEFLARCEQITGQPVELISGKREAKLSALGIVSGIWKPDGMVGDLGGGSLELIDVQGHTLASGVSLQLGGLALQDRSKGGNLRRPEDLAKEGAGRAAADRGMRRAGRSTPSAARGARWRGCT